MVIYHVSANAMKEMGTPLMNGQALSPDGNNKMVVGYSVLQAENMEEAKGLLNGHPHLAWNAQLRFRKQCHYLS